MRKTALKIFIILHYHSHFQCGIISGFSFVFNKFLFVKVNCIKFYFFYIFVLLINSYILYKSILIHFCFEIVQNLIYTNIEIRN